MHWANTKRILRAGFINFWRNGVISVASTFVVVVTLFIIGSIILGHALLLSSLAEVQNKVDVNVYFKASASESDISALKTSVEKLAGVKSVELISREQALTQFRERNKDNALVLQSLDEVGGNPFGAAINVKANELSQYDSIARFLNSQNDALLSAGKPAIIDEVTYKEDTDTKVVIDRLTNIINSTNRLGVVVSLLLALMAAMVTFNTVRLAIYNMRQEIAVMRLVGANNSFIRGPFVVEGIMYGIMAALIALILLYPASAWVTRTTKGIYGGIDLLHYYLVNLPQLFLVLVSAGIFLGMISSIVAVRRYLKERGSTVV